MQKGTCFSCKSGFYGSKCCAAGWYGSGCIQQCRGHCKHSVPCNHVTGLCDNGCSDEWKGTFCEIEKVVTFKYKTVSQSTTYPGIKYDARYAVDKNVTTCARTEVIGTTSVDQTVWWKVDLGVMSIVQRVNILFRDYTGFEMRQRGRFAGFSIHVSTDDKMNSESLCYRDEGVLPPLNFTTECAVLNQAFMVKTVLSVPQIVSTIHVI
uniref:Uncharacterized protein LOC111116524 n=1 Tax=Crassostrea virginica TaxID=6565 RepID=A0A8B8C8Y0_CRAVI|nr:uncharacterized protein LOC111116524 [Crassostrea virginica]